MNKSEVCVRLTRKNCKKVLAILEMFGEPVYNGDKYRWSKGVLYSGDKYAAIDNFGDWIGFTKHQLTDWYPDKKVVKPRELRNILAKEHLKVGDVIIVNNPSNKKGWVIKIGYGSKDVFCHSVSYSLDSGALRINPVVKIVLDGNFLRYATDEEKSLLEPKQTIYTVDPVNSFTGSIPGKISYTREVWVNHYSDHEFHVHKKKSTADHLVHLNGNLGRRVQTVRATLTYDIPMTKV